MKKIFLLFCLLIICYTSNAQNPVLNFTMSAQNIYIGESVVFYNTSTGLPHNTKYIWVFQDCLDSQTLLPSTSPCFDTVVGTNSLVHFYSVTGTFTVELQIENEGVTPVTKSVNISLRSVDACASNCNLVCNGNFEAGTCPSNSGQIFRAPSWYDPTNGSSDLYRTCGTNSSCSVPNNTAGTGQSPRSGNSYAGQWIKNWILAPGYPNGKPVREYMSSPLVITMVAGTTYNIRMYVLLANRPLFCGGPVFPSSIGALFTNTSIPMPPYANANDVLAYTPSIVLTQPSGLALTSKTNWMLVCGNYTATGLEKFITIGDFSSDAANKAYYFFDDVSVEEWKANAGADITKCQGGIGNILGSQCILSDAVYTWTPTSGLSCSVCPNPTANPLVTTTYTLTISDPAGCAPTKTDVVIVTVNPPPTVGASASPSTISVPATSQLYAATSPGVTTYSWSPSGSLNNPTIFDPVASPTVTTVYTVTVTDMNGCTAKATVMVTVVPPQCNLPNPIVINNGDNSSVRFGTLPGYPTISGQNIIINGTLNINTSITFSNCNILMAGASSKIQLLNTSQLQINNQTHLYSCTVMWEGIYVASGTSLITGSSAFIEDAIHAVNLSQGGTATIDQTIFNKDMVAAYLNTNTLGTSPITITGSVVTCRNIPSFAVTTSNPAVATVRANIILTTPTYTTTVLKSPYSGQKGFCGVYAFNVNTLNVGSNNAAASLNYFDAIMSGVNLYRSNAIIYNNQFQNMNGYNYSLCEPFPSTLNCYQTSGYGIIAAGLANTGTHSITVGGNPGTIQANTFKNTYMAISITSYKTHIITGNSISNTNTGPFTNGMFNNGKNGIYIVSPTANNVISIQNQTLIKNCESAIYVTRNNNNALNTTSLLIENNGNVDVNPSTVCITADAAGYCTNGIYISDLLNGTLTQPTGWVIQRNVITETANCITLLNVKNLGQGNGNYSVNSNSCGVRYNSGSTNTNGIVAKGCDRIQISSNHTKYNNVGGLAYNSGGNINSYGIYLQRSTNMFVNCNQIDDAARSMVFDNACTSTYGGPLSTIGIYNNTMRRAQDGFVLLNSGVIGTQGNSTLPCFNYWDNTSTPTFTRSQTMADASDANTSKLYVINTPTTLPTSNVLINFPATAYSGTSLLNATGTQSYCSTPPAAAGGGNGSERGGEDKTVYAAYLQTMAEDITQLPVYSDASHWQRRKFVFNEVKNDAQLTANTGLQRFYNNTVNANIGKLSQIDEQILQSNYTLANSINSGIVASNTIEENQQTVNRLILRKLINDKYTYTSADTKVVTAIANQCPISGGDGVYQARVLLMTIQNNVIEFEDNCDEKSSGRSVVNNLQNISDTNKSFNLYPNPNDGNMIFEYSLPMQSTGTFILYDITGRVINKYNLAEGENNSLKISESDLKNGVYFYSVIIDNTVKAYSKIVIVQ